MCGCALVWAPKRTTPFVSPTSTSTKPWTLSTLRPYNQPPFTRSRTSSSTPDREAVKQYTTSIVVVQTHNCTRTTARTLKTPHFLFPPLAHHEPPPEEQDRRERKFSLLTLHYSSGTHKAPQDKSQWHPLTSSPPLPQSLTPEEQRLFRLYGKLPSRSDHFAKHLKERKYFDSGDYAMSKAGKGDGVDTGTVGSQHPVPENIPHNSGGSSSNGVGGGAATATPPGLTKSGSISGASGGLPGGLAGSPAKESSSGLVRETSAEEDPDNKENAGDAAQQGIPIRS